MSTSKRIQLNLRSAGWIAALVVILASATAADDGIVWLFDFGVVIDRDLAMSEEEVCAAAYDKALGRVEFECERFGGELLYDSCSIIEEHYLPPGDDTLWPICLVELGCICVLPELD